ncbi:MAG: 4-hydroxy-tetrahydrodipicolinate synthase [Deltaproteobacteria bacterium]|nr:4-hydroxy-tetrahydrodipicolinate synthase [Deltaproteobacteria bacterium]MBI3386488.1 4-hydroxy-tetrahydrodipicolinate synthase [Deltaproteobacteria bacterium]
MITLDENFLRGSFPPLVTPFNTGEVDYDKFAELVEFQIEHGSHGIVVCGTTGEPSLLTIDERMQLLQVAINTADGRIPVVAATGAQSHAESAELLEHAADAGAAAALIVTPYYIKPPQRGLVEYFVDLGTRTGLPLLLYHIPGRTAVDLPLDTIERIAEKIPRLVGIKLAVNDLGFATKLLVRFGTDFRLFVGLEELSFPLLAIGAAGLMNAVGNIAPRKLVDLCDAVAGGDLAAARTLHFDLFELNQAVFFDTNPIPIKWMMRRMGLLDSNEHRLPMVPATYELEQRLDGVLQRAGLIAAA